MAKYEYQSRLTLMGYRISSWLSLLFALAILVPIVGTGMEILRDWRLEEVKGKVVKVLPYTEPPSLPDEKLKLFPNNKKLLIQYEFGGTSFETFKLGYAPPPDPFGLIMGRERSMASSFGDCAGGDCLGDYLSLYIDPEAPDKDVRFSKPILKPKYWAIGAWLFCFKLLLFGFFIFRKKARIKV